MKRTSNGERPTSNFEYRFESTAAHGRPPAVGIRLLTLYLQRSFLCLAVSALLVGCAQPKPVDLFLTADQQGQRAYDRGDVSEAARLFEDPLWKATALYLDQQFGAALEQFARVDSAEAWFGRGSCLAQMEQYEEAIAAFNRALDLRPDYREAHTNIDYLQPFLPLHFEGGDMGMVGKDAEADEVVFDADADSLAERGKDTELEEGGMLSEAQMAEMWLRQVDTSTASFLKHKFRYQAAQMDQGGR